MTLSTLTKLRRQSGFTLVELLIVMLIVGILSIAMLPMYKKYMTKAKYTAEGLPILATIKTQVDLSIYDKSYAPGVQDTVYTWYRDPTTGDYVPGVYVYGSLSAIPDASTTNPYTGSTADATGWHLRKLIKESELQGKLIHPNHVFYACINSGIPTNLDPTGSATMAGDYGYAIGVFGDGNGLPQNSGVATMEVHMSAPKVGTNESGDDVFGVTVLGSWSNFDGSGIDPNGDGQIKFCDSGTPLPGGCGIWSNATMFGINGGGASGSTPTFQADVQPAIDQLVTGLECGDWEFPTYAQ